MNKTVNIIAVFIVVFLQCGCSHYIYQAYFKTDSTGNRDSIRGYPIIEPPENFTGIWTHYKWNGAKLADISYIKGRENGLSCYYQDSGKPYCIIKTDPERPTEEYYHEDIQMKRASIPFWFPAKYYHSVQFYDKMSERRIKTRNPNADVTDILRKLYQEEDKKKRKSKILEGRNATKV